jgi:hypothetical protein
VRLREFRASWKNGALTTQQKRHRLNGFFDFCTENEWLHKNPSKKTKPVQVSLDPPITMWMAARVKLALASSLASEAGNPGFGRPYYYYCVSASRTGLPSAHRPV